MNSNGICIIWSFENYVVSSCSWLFVMNMTRSCANTTCDFERGEATKLMYEVAEIMA